MRNKFKILEERTASICNISSLLRFGVNTQLYDKHTDTHPGPTREQIYVLFLYGGPPPPSLNPPQSRSQLTFPTIIGGHIMFCERASERALFHQRYQNSHVHSTPLTDKGNWLLPISSSSSSPFAHWILITPKSGGFTFRCIKKRSEFTLWNAIRRGNRDTMKWH